MAVKQYLNNKNLYKEIIISKAQGRLTKDAEKMIHLLAKNIIKKFNYTDIKDKEDCLQEGLYQLFKNWKQFDENKTENAFAYFTEVFKRGVAFGFNKYHKKVDGEYISNLRMDYYYEDGSSLDI